MTELTDDFLAVEAASIPKNQDLGEISGLAKEVLRLEDVKAQMLADMQEIDDKIYRLTAHEIPEKMQQLGLAKLTLDSGAHLEVKDVVRASIPAGKQEEALQWLRDNGQGDLIKNEVKVYFAAGEDEVAKSLINYISESQLPNNGVEQKTFVHAQTLTAFCRRRLEKGEPLNNDLLGVYVGRVAKLQRPKETVG